MTKKSEVTQTTKLVVLEKIDEFVENVGYAPSVREICRMMNFSSSATGQKYINLLVEDGYLEKSANGNRTLRRINNPKALPEGTKKVPVVGLVTAGMPITAVENITGYVAFVSERKRDGQLFALRVRGESMINAGIFDGDLIIVEQVSYADNGDMVVALVDGEEATVKTFYKEDGHYRLQPENDYMEPIIVDDVEILGKVVGLQREF